MCTQPTIHARTTIGEGGWKDGWTGRPGGRGGGRRPEETILIRGMEYPRRATPGESLGRDRRNSYLRISRGDQISKLNLERIYCLQISREASTLLCIFEDVRPGYQSIAGQRTGLYWPVEDVRSVPKDGAAIFHSGRRKLNLGHKFITRPLT